MDKYVVRMRCNLSGASCDVPMPLTRHEYMLLNEISEKIRTVTEWDFQMEVLHDTQNLSEDGIRMAQEALLEGLKRGMITPEEASEYFAEGDFPEG